MFSNPNLLDYVMLLFGLLVCFKKVAEMERYHDLRVIILTSIVGAIVLLFFIAFATAFDDAIHYDCQCADHFTLSEI